MPKRYLADDIARYFLARTEPDVGELISNLKLQKLCYYAQALGVVVRGEPFFSESLEAWQHGPVVPALYRKYKKHRNGAIPAIADLDLAAYDPQDAKLLNDVYEYYGQFSAWRLREMTHQELPWLNAYNRPKKIIDLSELKQFFKTKVKSDYVRAYHERQLQSSEA